jgi:hypothetical protein
VSVLHRMLTRSRSNANLCQLTLKRHRFADEAGSGASGCRSWATQVSRLDAMVDQVQQIAAALPELTDVTGVWEVAERRLADGDAAFVAELGIALDERDRSATDQVWQYRGVFDYLLRLLTTTPGRKNVEQALRLAAAARSGGWNKDPGMASLLASGQTPEDLAVVFAGGGAPGGASGELRPALFTRWCSEAWQSPRRPESPGGRTRLTGVTTRWAGCRSRCPAWKRLRLCRTTAPGPAATRARSARLKGLACCWTVP